MGHFPGGCTNSTVRLEAMHELKIASLKLSKFLETVWVFSTWSLWFEVSQHFIYLDVRWEMSFLWTTKHFVGGLCVKSPHTQSIQIAFLVVLNSSLLVVSLKWCSESLCSALFACLEIWGCQLPLSCKDLQGVACTGCHSGSENLNFIWVAHVFSLIWRIIQANPSKSTSYICISWQTKCNTFQGVAFTGPRYNRAASMSKWKLMRTRSECSEVWGNRMYNPEN